MRGRSTINPEDEEYDPENPMPEEVEETYTMPQTTARYTSDEDPLFVVEVDGEGGTKHIHLPYPYHNQLHALQRPDRMFY